ncbi:MAG TPA: family 10 glycosylhydrolase [Candidatus Glassbacteria bacterium]|nr:family 10 glycosylhydrolase [Candidatus Glassbacteria bacterium]
MLFPAAGSAEGRVPQARALWVVRTTLLSRQGIDRMVESAARGEFNHLFVQVCGRGDSYFPSNVYPPAENCRELLATGFDPLAYVIEKAHARNIKVHAWVNALLVWSSAGRPEDSRHMLNSHPEWMMVDRSGTSLARYSMRQINKLRLTGVFLSPAVPEAVRLVQDFVLDLARRYPLDGVHLDYIRYPMKEVDFTGHAREGFRRKYGADPVDLFNRDDRRKNSFTADQTDRMRKQWAGYRAELVTDLVAGLSLELNRIKPGLVRSAAVMPEIAGAFETFGQDWPRWIRAGYLDMVLPMAYSTKTEVVYSQVAAACRAVGAEKVWPGLRAYEVPVAGVIERARRIAPLDTGGISFFSYDGVRDNPGFFDRVRQSLFTR